MDGHVYVDHALNGVGAARPGLANLIAAVVSHAKPFEVILVDDFYKEARFCSMCGQKFCSTNITQMAEAGQDQAERKQKFLELLTKIED